MNKFKAVTAVLAFASVAACADPTLVPETSRATAPAAHNSLGGAVADTMNWSPPLEVGTDGAPLPTTPMAPEERNGFGMGSGG